MVNETLIRDTIEYIEQHPDEWDQTSFGAELYWPTGYYERADCEACFFGNLVVLASQRGYRFTTDSVFALARVTGVTVDQFREIFHWYPDKDLSKDVQLKELKAKVTEVTGIEF